jgi:hypothetical protein
MSSRNARARSSLRTSTLTATTSKSSPPSSAGKAVERGHLDPARHAPGRPQVEENGAAGEIGQRQRTAVRRRKRNIVEPFGRLGHPESSNFAGRQRLDPGGGCQRPVASGGGAIAIGRASDIYRDRPGDHPGDGGDADQHESALSPTSVRHPSRVPDHEKPHVGRPVLRGPRCRHGGDQRVDRFRPAPLPAGHPGLEGPCPNARQTGHHRAGRCRKDRGRSRHDPARNRSRRLHVFAFAGRHPHERRAPACRADRPGGRPAAYRALAQRPGRHRHPKLWVRDAIDETRRGARAPAAALADKALAAAATVMPGFTHLQTAQPVTFGHHLLAYVEMLGRDRGRFADARKRLNESPLGAAALAGTSFPIDRDMTARALGFDRPTANSLDAVSDRDFVSRRSPRRASAPCICRASPRNRDLVDAAVRLRAAVRPVLDRLVDHAAEAQSRRGRTGARQDRPHRRRADRAADRA